MFQLLVFILLVSYTSSSHYRGGSISWDIRQDDYIPNSSTVSVRLYQRHSWRRSAAPSFWNKPECDASTIANGSAVLGESSLVCNSNDCLRSVSLTDRSILATVLCTDYSVDYDYASGEKYTTLNLPINKRLIYTYESCCWIGLLPSLFTPGWLLNLIIDTHRRIDGKFNSAPVSTMNPIVKVQIGQVYIINIPMADIDGDQLRCRWGANESESGGIYYSKGVLQSNPCQLTYNATTIGYEGVALVIEDFDSNNQVLSSIPIQFLIQIVPSIPVTPAPTMPTNGYNATFSPPVVVLPPCSQPPEYKGDWRAGACIGVASNNITQTRIVVKIPCANSSTSIKDILTISPSGMTKGPIMQDSDDNDTYIMYLQWTPRSNQYGIQQLCVTPVDNSSQTGQTVCFTFLVDVQAPEFVLNSTTPTGLVSQNQSMWTIVTNVDIVPPRDSNVSAIFFKRNTWDSGNDVEVIRVSTSTATYQSRQITFNTGNTIWEQGQQYYILLEGGVATINQSCGIQSAPIIDTEFWTFAIAAVPTTAEAPSTITTILEETSTSTTTTEQTSTTTTTPESTTTTTESTTTTSTTTPQPTTTTSQSTTTTTESTTTTTPEPTSTTTTTTESTTPQPTSTTTTTTESTSTATTTTPQPISTTTTTTATDGITSYKIITTTTTDSTTARERMTTTTTTVSNSLCFDWLLFGTIKNITTNDYQRNYTFCFYVNTTLADVTVAANTWTPCTTWKISGAADPLMDLYDINNKPILLAQNDDGNSIPELNCYAAVISYRLTRGSYRVIIRHSKCNYGNFELRLSAETTNALK